MSVCAAVRCFAGHVHIGPLTSASVLREDVVAAGAKTRVGHLVLVDQVEVLLEIAALVEAHCAALEHAVERLLLGVDS